MNNSKENKFLYYGSILWLYTKYQILTKLFLALIIFPTFKIILKMLMASAGRTGISSGDYLQFLLSIQGVGLLIISILCLAILIGTDINAFIIMSALIKENRIKLKARDLLFVGLKSLKAFIRPTGILIMLYIALMIPLVGVGLSVSVMKNFKIPNFITDVIFKNPLYFSGYVGLMIILTIITILHIFFFHYLIIDERGIGEALSKSAALMRKHWKVFIKEFFLKSLLRIFLLTTLLMVALIGIFIYAQRIEEIIPRRFFSLFVLLLVSEILALIGVMTVPLITYRLTDLFYRFNQEDGYDVCLKMNVYATDLGDDIFKKIRLRTKFSLGLSLVLVLIFNFFVALFVGIFFDEVFEPNRNIAIVAHRGGGDLAAENSILGMERAAKEGAKWSEIDVQRTQDGYYIINHDKTFSRVADESRTAQELTLEEIRELKVKDLFLSDRPAQPVPTLEEYLDAAKDKIGLFIELKGSSADEKMVDDVVVMVKERNMEKSVALLSLDYQLIKYIEETYPEMDTGYLYFFSIGETSQLKADILIMEEEEATPQKIDAIHSANKKAIVWTVNTDESVQKFVLSDVDGIITDYVLKVKEGITNRDNRNDMEIIIDAIME